MHGKIYSIGGSEGIGAGDRDWGICHWVRVVFSRPGGRFLDGKHHIVLALEDQGGGAQRTVGTMGWFSPGGRTQRTIDGIR